MRVWPPFRQLTQSPEQQYETAVPDLVSEVTGVPFPACSYRLRWNERTESWECDWYDENLAPIDQGRRLSANWFLRTPWLDGSNPAPMPAWIMFLDEGATGAECDYEGLGRTHDLCEFTREEIEDFQAEAGEPVPWAVSVEVH